MDRRHQADFQWFTWFKLVHVMISSATSMLHTVCIAVEIRSATTYSPVPYFERQSSMLVTEILCYQHRSLVDTNHKHTMMLMTYIRVLVTKSVVDMFKVLVFVGIKERHLR